MYIINNQVSENTAFKSRKFFRYIKTKEETANKAISQDDDSIFLSYSNIKSSTGFWSTIISKIKNLFESGRTEAVSYIKDDGKSDKTLDSFKFEKQVILQGRKNHPSDIKETDNITPKKEPNYSSYYEENGNTAHEYGYNDFNTTIKEVKNPNGELIRKEFSDTMGY